MIINICYVSVFLRRPDLKEKCAYKRAGSGSAPHYEFENPDPHQNDPDPRNFDLTQINYGKFS